MATVMGPTPPGTGVMASATSDTGSKSTSPSRRYPRSLVASSTRLMPTSMTTAPGFTMSEQIESRRESLQFNIDMNLAGRALKRDEVPEDLLGTMVFLASPESDFMTGQTILVDGGLVMH